MRMNPTLTTSTSRSTGLGESHRDSLFPGGVGNTFGDADNFTSLINDVESKIFGRFDDDTRVYPGHGNDLVRLGDERGNLAEWRERGW